MAFELQSGAAVLPVVGAMYGPNAVSETALVRNLVLQLPEESVVMGDAGFGIFPVAYEARQTSHDFALRLRMSLVAYNLVGEFRREAARKAKVIPRKLSFKGVLTTFNTFLLEEKFTTAASWRAGYELALHDAMQAKLPNRPNHSYEREAYHQRPKSSQFKRRIPKNALPKPDQ